MSSFFASAGESSAACSTTSSSEPVRAISCRASLVAMPDPGMCRRFRLETDEFGALSRGGAVGASTRSGV